MTRHVASHTFLALTPATHDYLPGRTALVRLRGSDCPRAPVCVTTVGLFDSVAIGSCGGQVVVGVVNNWSVHCRGVHLAAPCHADAWTLPTYLDVADRRRVSNMALRVGYRVPLPVFSGCCVTTPACPHHLPRYRWPYTRTPHLPLPTCHTTLPHTATLRVAAALRAPTLHYRT